MPSNTRPHWALGAYVVGTVILTSLLLVLDVIRPPLDFPHQSPIFLLVVLAITVGAEQISFRVHRGWISAAATLPHIAAAHPCFVCAPSKSHVCAGHFQNVERASV